jgi:hypothetical protein
VENVNVAQGTVVRITETPLEGIGVFDMPAPIGQPPLASPPSPSDAANDIALTLNVSPADPQASPTPTPPGSVVLLNTLTNDTLSFTSSPPRIYMGDRFIKT